MRVHQLNLLLLAGLLVVPTLPAAALENFDALDAYPEVQECVRAAWSYKSLSQEISLRVFDESTMVSEASADLYWKLGEDGLSRALIRFTGPPDKVGLALLVVEPETGQLDQDMTIYLPELRATRRIVARALAGSMFGTDFSYADFAELQGIAQSRTLQRLPDEMLGERMNYVIEAVPGSPDSQYSRIVTFFDQQLCTPMLIRFFADDGTPSKEVTVPVDELREFGGRSLPTHIVMTDFARAGRTEIIVHDIKVDPNLSDLMFTRGALARGR